MKAFWINLLIVFILFLTTFNVYLIHRPKQILGVQTQNTTVEKEFWESFLKENPNYIPGWIELRRMDKVIEIDPNYFLQP